MTTVVVLDLAHCGTTMVAGTLEILGVPMVGRKYNPAKWEDTEIIEALRDEWAFAELVDKRSGRWGLSRCSDPDCPSCSSLKRTWGFKYPGAWKFAPLLRKYLDDAVYLAIYKDPVSVTRRRFGTISASKLRNTIRQIEDSIDGIIASGLPVEFLSYKEAVMQPRTFVMRLALFCGGSTLDRIDKAEQYIQPGAGYPSVGEWLE